MHISYLARIIHSDQLHTLSTLSKYQYSTENIIHHTSQTHPEITAQLTLNVKVSLKTGLSVLRWTLVSNFFFLSGSRYVLTYGSDVPDMSIPGRSAAWMTPTDSCKQQNFAIKSRSQVEQYVKKDIWTTLHF